MCVILYIYSRQSNVKYMHFELAAGSDNSLWFPCNVTYQFLDISDGNVMPGTNGFLVIVHFSYPSALNLLFWVSLPSCKDTANEHRNRKHFYFLTLGINKGN